MASRKTPKKRTKTTARKRVASKKAARSGTRTAKRKPARPIEDDLDSARRELDDERLKASGVDVVAYRKAEASFEAKLVRARDERIKRIADMELHQRLHAGARELQGRVHMSRMPTPILSGVGTTTAARDETPVSLLPPCPIIGHSEHCGGHAWSQGGHLFDIDEAGSHARVDPNDPCHIQMLYGIGHAIHQGNANSWNAVQYQNTPIGSAAGLWCVRARVSSFIHLFPVFNVPSDVLVKSTIHLSILDASGNAVAIGGPETVLYQTASWPNQPPPNTHFPINFSPVGEVSVTASLDPGVGPHRVSVFCGVEYINLDPGQYASVLVDTHFEGIEWGVAGAVLPSPYP